MDWWLATRIDVLPLVAARMIALVMTLPAVSNQAVPLRIRLLFAGSLTILTLPLAVPDSGLPSQMGWTLGPGLLYEVVVGMSFGLSAGILLSSARIVSGMLGLTNLNTMGQHLAEGWDGSGSPTDRLVWWLAILAFFSLRGEQQVVGAVLDSYQTYPLGGKLPSHSILAQLTQILTESTLLGWRIALPVAGAGLVSLTAISLLQRMLPPAQAIAFGLPAVQIVSLALLFLSLGSITWAYADQLSISLNQLSTAVAPTASGIRH